MCVPDHFTTKGMDYHGNNQCCYQRNRTSALEGMIVVIAPFFLFLQRTDAIPEKRPIEALTDDCNDQQGHGRKQQAKQEPRICTKPLIGAINQAYKRQRETQKNCRHAN